MPSAILTEMPMAAAPAEGAAQFEAAVRLEADSSKWQFDFVGESPRRVSGFMELALTDETGQVRRARVEQCVVGPNDARRTTQLWHGEFGYRGRLRVRTRWNFCQESGLITVEITLHNPNRARHAGGLWDLGDSGSILFRDLSLHVELDTEDVCSIRYRCEPDAKLARLEQGAKLEIHQESSGGENWNSETHLNRLGVVPLRYRGYRGQADGKELSGLRAQPVVELSSGGASLTAEISEFWQQFPKAITATGNRITLHLFPEQSGELFELQGGEQKTHRVRFKIGSAESVSLASEGFPKVVGTARLVPGMPETSLRVNNAGQRVLEQLDELGSEFLEGPNNVFKLREQVDEYGWRNYGDVYADHEVQHYHGTKPHVSHYNNQFDLLAGFLLAHLRTRDGRWWNLADALARHVVDIDIYHTREDRPAYNGGLFWFTDHYLHAETSTHRTYSRKNQPAQGEYGGGPGPEHCFTTGLLAHYLLTGYAESRSAVLELAAWVMAMDDGRQTILGAVDEGPTGKASATADPLYHGPGRGAGNSVNALLDGWLLSRERCYLAQAERLIRRAVHPADDVGSLGLLRAEKRWSYSVFLVSLAKYLDFKAQSGELDEMYAYAQASLVHYGEWMLAHERPYFDRQEELEYPTEAWAAQELRKANVLRLAAQHATEPLRTKMFDRGDELANRAWSDLWRFSTRTTARAMAVVLTEGLRDAELRCRKGEKPRFEDTVAFPPRETFLPQRERVKRRLTSARGLAGMAVSLANPRKWRRLLNSW